MKYSISLCALAMVVVLLSTRWVRLNVSASVPLGLYRVLSVPPSLPRGAFVLLSAPETMRPWWPSGLALLKPVAAIGGDEVCNVEQRLMIRAADYGPIYTEADGKILPSLVDCVTVPPDSVFLASPHPKSLDGRYWGMTLLSTLTAQAVPLWTWR